MNINLKPSENSDTFSKLGEYKNIKNESSIYTNSKYTGKEIKEATPLTIIFKVKQNKTKKHLGIKLRL